MVSISYPDICERIRNTQLPGVDLVIGIGTGGVVPAAIVAFYLKVDLSVITINYRDENNVPRFEMPAVIDHPEEPPVPGGKRILLVDDVSVSGKTLKIASDLLKGNQVTTLTLKGKADYVLFPEIGDCVKWPWKP